MKLFEEKTITRKSIFKGRVIEVAVDEVELPNGEQSSRELVFHGGAVAIIPVTSDGKIILVEQYRKALERSIIEIPAGKLEKDEDPLVCAKRELEEETGYVSNEPLELLTSMYVSPGYGNEIVHIYFARNVEEIDNKAPLDEDEFVETHFVTLEEMAEMVRDNRIQDAKTLYAYLYLVQKNS